MQLTDWKHVLSVLADLIGNHELQKHLTSMGIHPGLFGTEEFFSFRKDLFYLPVWFIYHMSPLQRLSIHGHREVLCLISSVFGNRFVLMSLTPMEPLYYLPIFLLGSCVSYTACDVERRILWIPGFVCSWQALLHFPPLCAHLPWWCSLPWISNPLCPSLWTAALLLDSSQILTQ